MSNSQNFNDWDFFDNPSADTYEPRRSTQKKRQTRKPFKKSWLIVVVLVVLAICLLDNCSNSAGNQIIRQEDTLWPENSNQETPDSEIASQDIHDEFQYYYYTQLTTSQQGTYDIILAAMKNMDSKCEIQEANKEILQNIMIAIMLDHPELFWCTGAYSYTNYNDYVEFSPTYAYGKIEKNSRQTQVDNAANEILSKIQSDWTKYEKIKYVFEQVAKRVEYVTGSPDNQNIYSSLVNKKSVCAGYTRACQYLLHKLGIECLYVSGMVRETESHAWNIVKCNGNYYHMDATFGDRAFDANVQSNRPEELDLNYGFLCCSDQEMYSDRYSDVPYKLPICNLTDLNYYKKQGAYYDYYSEAIFDVIKESVNKGETIWQCQFSNEQDYQQMLSVIKSGKYANIVGEYKKNNGDNSQFTAWYSEDSTRYTISCWY